MINMNLQTFGGRGSRSGGGAGQGNGGTAGRIRVREGMTFEEINDVNGRIADMAREAAAERDAKMGQLSQQVMTGQIPVSEMSGRIESINREYDATMEPLRRANDEMGRLYGIRQQL